MESNQGPVVDPAAASLHILLVDANIKSRQTIETLLNSCNYQVTACKTGQEAIQVLKAQQGPGGVANFDLILKEHCPVSGTNATRFLRRAQTEPCMQGIPVIVASAVEDRNVMVSCLQLGAADFMLKPLRASELRNLWARVYWWRRATWHQPAALNSNPVSMNDSKSGSGSRETRGVSIEPQEAAFDEGGSGDASIPTTNTDNGTDDTARPSKASKDLLGWSGTKITGPDGLAQQSSNPSMPSEALPVPNSSKAFPSSTGGFGGPIKPQAQKFSQLSQKFPPLDLQGRVAKPTANEDSQKGNTAGAPSIPGFRAYVATEPQQSLKRAMPDISSREDPGSSGSDWTGSLEKTDQNKRRAVMSSQDNPKSSLSALTQAWLQSQRSQSLTQRAQSLPTTGITGSQPLGPCQLLGDTDGKAGDHGKGQSASLPPGFPFCFVPGMMPLPFGMPPAVWNQNVGLKPGQNGAPVQVSGQQTNRKEQGSNHQAHQQAMHNQIMYHHNLLLQQYGMVPPYMPYSAFANAASQAQTHAQQQDVITKSNVPALPPASAALRHKSQPGLPANSSQMPVSERSNTPTVNLTSIAAPVACASPSSGVQQPPPAGAESTQDTAQLPNTGSNVLMEGFLLEPSRKQRRAEALHKYRQKRKNLNFTKKIRYESRKQLAQARPRVKGQFVRIPSEEVNAAVDSLTPAQMKEVAEGTSDVADLLIENARQDAAGFDLRAEDTKDVEISDEDETVTRNEEEEEDVSSLVSKDGQKVIHCMGNNASSPQKPSLLDNTRRNSSQSGSNSLGTEAHLLIGACG